MVRARQDPFVKFSVQGDARETAPAAGKGPHSDLTAHKENAGANADFPVCRARPGRAGPPGGFVVA